MTAGDEARRPAALVTGAANGLGETLVRRLADLGYDLAILDLDRARLDVVADDLRSTGIDVLAEAVDVSDTAALTEALARVGERFGCVEICAPFAGVFSSLAVDRGDGAIDLVNAINVEHVVTCGRWAQDAAAGHRRRLHIVLSGSSSGVTRHPDDQYARSKQRVLLVALQLRWRGRRMAVSSRRPQRVTLGIIHPTRTEFGRNSERVFGEHIAGDSDRADRLAKLDTFLDQHGRAPDVVISDLLDAVDRHRTSVELTGSERSALMGRVNVDALLPAAVLLADLRHRGRRR